MVTRMVGSERDSEVNTTTRGHPTLRGHQIKHILTIVILCSWKNSILTYVFTSRFIMLDIHWIKLFFKLRVIQHLKILVHKKLSI